MKATLADLIEEMRNGAQVYPDTVYDYEGQTCPGYTTGKASNGQCGCLVGQALAELGVKLPPGSEYLPFDQLQEDLGLPGTKVQEGWVYFVQREQDNGVPWAKAVANADADQEK